MKLLCSFCGADFEPLREEFLNSLTHADHRWVAKAHCCIATKWDARVPEHFQAKTLNGTMRQCEGTLEPPIRNQRFHLMTVGGICMERLNSAGRERLLSSSP